MSKSPVELTLVIVSYNTQKITLQCIESIYKHTTKLNFEIIVVDNDSHDGSVESLKKLAKKHPSLRIVAQNSNPGFGSANNVGAKAAKGEYLLFINSDTLIRDNNLEKCLSYLKNHQNIGALSCRLNNTDGTPQSNGGYFPNILNVLAWQLFIDDLPLLKALIPSIHPKTDIYTHNQSLDWVTGAYLMISKEDFDRIGGFDKKIFMYGEDLDLCYKLRSTGKDIQYLADESITHLGNASSGSQFALTNEAKNLVYVFSKYHSRIETNVIKLTIKLGSLLRWAVFGIIQHDEGRKKTYHDILVTL